MINTAIIIAKTANIGSNKGKSAIWLKIIGKVIINGAVKIKRGKKSSDKGIRNIYRFIIWIINFRLPKLLKLKLLKANCNHQINFLIVKLKLPFFFPIFFGLFFINLLKLQV